MELRFGCCRMWSTKLVDVERKANWEILVEMLILNDYSNFRRNVIVANYLGKLFNNVLSSHMNDDEFLINRMHHYYVRRGSRVS